ncbi:MAG: PorT family protein [Lentimicrobiaceae bacterium]|nr:PorT family protein [Lentimicrobiaceae bacterium]
MKNFERRLAGYFIILLTLSSLPLFAQRNPHEFSVHTGGGVSFFGYQSPLSDVFSIGYNCELGGGFTGFVSEMCGFHVGAGFGLFKVKTNVGDLVNCKRGQTDKNGFPFELYSTLSGYNETHKTLFINLPVMFHFQTKPKWAWKGRKSNFYAKAGAKLLILLNRSYDSEIKNLYNVAYYPEFDNWTGTQIFAGLGNFPGKAVNGKTGVGVLAMFACEAGMKWVMGDNLYLYAGAYFDCGLHELSANDRKPASNYTNREQLNEFSLLEFYDKSILMGVGIRVRLAFNKH